MIVGFYKLKWMHVLLGNHQLARFFYLAITSLHAFLLGNHQLDAFLFGSRLLERLGFSGGMI